MKVTIIIPAVFAALAAAVPPGKGNPRPPPPPPPHPHPSPAPVCAALGGKCYVNTDCCVGTCGPRIAIYPDPGGKCELPPPPQPSTAPVCAALGGKCFTNTDCCVGICGPRPAIYPDPGGKCEVPPITTTIATPFPGPSTVTLTATAGPPVTK